MRTESPELTKLTIESLIVAPENVCKNPSDDQSNAELRSSILHHGLTNNLAATKPNKDGEPH